MMRHTYTPQCVCATEITFDLDGDILHNVRFSNGCDGNAKAVASLVEGMPAREVLRRLKGIDCDGKGTSCTDQLAIALEKALGAKHPAG